MECVYVISFTEEPEQRVAASKEKAFEICFEYLGKMFQADWDVPYAIECIKELFKTYEEDTDFYVDEVFYVRQIEVEY